MYVDADTLLLHLPIHSPIHSTAFCVYVSVVPVCVYACLSPPQAVLECDVERGELLAEEKQLMTLLNKVGVVGCGGGGGGAWGVHVCAWKAAWRGRGMFMVGKPSLAAAVYDGVARTPASLGTVTEQQ